jgi:hypothetical protein
MPPAQPPLFLAFGKQLGTFLTGHSLLIPGRPNSWSPLLARHFFLIETLMRAPADALYFAHSISCFFSYPNRTDLVAAASDDSRARLRAQVFWGGRLSSTVRSGGSGGNAQWSDSTAMAYRAVGVAMHLTLLGPWFVTAACFPGMVHQVLATGAGVTHKKYETTADGNPDQVWYRGHIMEMQRLEQIHAQAAQSAFFCPITCFLALFWIIVWRNLGRGGGGNAQNAQQRWTPQVQGGAGWNPSAQGFAPPPGYGGMPGMNPTGAYPGMPGYGAGGPGGAPH